MHHRQLESLSRQDTFIHRLDPRVKFIVVILFTALLVATSRYALARLAPFTLMPAFLLLFGEVRAGLVARALAMMAPFIILVAIWNPIYDRQVIVFTLGGVTFGVSAGWVSFANILMRFVLAASALVGLMATTPFEKLLEGLRRLALPRMFVTVLAFVYRYLFDLVDVALRMRRARDLRGGRAGVALRLRSSAGIVGNLFVRSLDRSDRVYKAMLARGFDGEMRSIDTLKMRRVDWVFAGAACASIAVMYLFAAGHLL